MAIDEIVKVVESSTKLLGTLVWPGILLFVLIRFGPALRDFFSSLGELSFKGAGFEASAKRKQEATAALVAATVARPAEGAPRNLLRKRLRQRLSLSQKQSPRE